MTRHMTGARTRRRSTALVRLSAVALALAPVLAGAQSSRSRARELGVSPGIFSPGPLNAITDVAGVGVGHATVIEGDSVRTGVTAIAPHAGDVFHERVPAAIHVGNGFGKLLGVTQVRELGELETPILLTCTLCVWRAADALVGWMLERPSMQDVRSINPVVAETNDGSLNAIRSRPIGASHVRAALAAAHASATGAGEGTTPAVAEGSVGAGTGTTALGWKGGIGTSSRVLPGALGGWTVGILVQSNFGGILQVLGAPVGRELGRYSFREHAEERPGDGSIIIVVATNAPLSSRNLERLAARAIMGLSRTGSFASNGSGDYVIAFSTSEAVRRPFGRDRVTTSEVGNDAMSPLFQAVVEATEEAIYNSLFMATTVSANGRTVDAIPLDRVADILAKYSVSER